jgi:hypothetical protein
MNAAVGEERKRKFKCKVCGKKFGATWEVAQHARKKHPKDKLQLGEQGTDESFLNNHTSYAFGHIQTWLDIYAGSVGIPATLLTSRLARLLLASTRGQVLGPNNNVSQVSGKTTKRTKVF